MNHNQLVLEQLKEVPLKRKCMISGDCPAGYKNLWINDFCHAPFTTMKYCPYVYTNWIKTNKEEDKNND